MYYVTAVIDDNNQFKSGIFRYDVEKAGAPELVLEINDKWHYENGHTGQGASAIAYYNGMLYYNTPKAVWKWNGVKDSKPVKVFDLPENISGEIWDIEVRNGKVYYKTGNGDTNLVQHEYTLAEGFEKKEQPIFILSKNMTVEVDEKEAFYSEMHREN